MTKRVVGLILMFIPRLLFAQTLAPSLAPPGPASTEFEVATIKPVQLDRMAERTFSGGSCHGVDKQYQAGSPIAPPPLGRCVFKLVTLNTLVAIAYKGAVAGGPAWTSSDFFDVEGKAEDTSTVSEAQLLTMLQKLLVSRFGLEFHHEERQVQGFLLYVAKNGSKLKEAVGDNPPRVRFGPGATVTAQHVTMDYFANSIRGMARGPVTDKTGLTGVYDFSFEWPAGDPDAFLSEMQAQLGLRVETTKVPTNYVVIDRVEKPTQQ